MRSSLTTTCFEHAASLRSAACQHFSTLSPWGFACQQFSFSACHSVGVATVREVSIA